ncbi:MAG: Membrane protein involved in colicin uptake [Rhodoferax sp.]|nr:Membrane protein involved in colicin uptake [Rhodoferax sp.]
MASPPFRFAGTLLAGASVGNTVAGTRALLCCAEPESHAEATGSRRTRLTELDSNFHCSVIGTCLGTAELRKLVPRFAAVDRIRASDLDLHHEAVQLAFDAGPGAKAIHKALDDRHDASIKRLQRVKNVEGLGVFWAESLKSGDVPGAYWALLTHPQVTTELRKLAFGDVHMLSHLVGASNRADIRRLQLLEQENGALSDKLERQQERLLETTAEREALTLRLSEQAILHSARSPRGNDDRLAETRAQLHQMQAELEAKDQALAHHTHRRDQAEAQMLERQNAAGLLQAQLDKALELVESLQAEVQAVEAELGKRSEPVGEAPLPHAVLARRRIVYVGGRPRSNQTIKAMVEAAGGELWLHDGGIEDRKGLLATALPRADMVVFPVDCIDHDSMSTLKRSCDKHQIPFYPVRSASAASFAALVARLAAPAAAVRAAPVSRFCLKHG